MKTIIDLLVLARMKKAGHSIIHSAVSTSVNIEDVNEWCKLHFSMSAFNAIQLLNKGEMIKYSRPRIVGFYKELEGERNCLLVSQDKEEITFFLDPQTNSVHAVEGRHVDMNKPIPHIRTLYEESGMAEINTIYYTLKTYCEKAGE